MGIRTNGGARFAQTTAEAKAAIATRKETEAFQAKL